MPNFRFSQALTANQLGFNPLTSWQYEYVPVMYGQGASVTLLMRSTTTGTRASVFSGSTSIEQRQPIQGGGTAGTTPSPLNTPATTFWAAPGDRLVIQIDEVAGGTPTVDGIISVDPI